MLLKKVVSCHWTFNNHKSIKLKKIQDFKNELFTNVSYTSIEINLVANFHKFKKKITSIASYELL